MALLGLLEEDTGGRRTVVEGVFQGHLSSTVRYWEYIVSYLAFACNNGMVVFPISFCLSDR